MFGLHFVKELGENTINIMSRKTFYNGDEIVDLSELIDKSKEFNVPLLLVRSYGMELILRQLEEKSDAVVGWNPHCIIDAIETLVDGGDWVKPCDVADEY